MQVEIKANGKSIQAEISEEQAKILGLITDKPKTGYERTKKGETYHVINTKDDSMINITEFNDETDEQCYNKGNYYNDEVIAENNARADKLLRCLRQWQALHDQPITVEDWEDKDKIKWCIMYGYGAEELYANCFYHTRLQNVIYFTTKEKAEEAIEQFKDELLWYFAEYMQRLDEVCG